MLCRHELRTIRTRLASEFSCRAAHRQQVFEQHADITLGRSQSVLDSAAGGHCVRLNGRVFEAFEAATPASATNATSITQRLLSRSTAMPTRSKSPLPRMPTRRVEAWSPREPSAAATSGVWSLLFLVSEDRYALTSDPAVPVEWAAQWTMPLAIASSRGWSAGGEVATITTSTPLAPTYPQRGLDRLRIAMSGCSRAP
jgi:hypothetical protein